MKSRPKAFDILAALFIGVALFLPLQVMVIYGHSPLEFSAIFNKLGPLNFLVMFLCFSNVVGLIRASSTLKVSIPATILIVGWNNWVVGLAATDYSMFATGFGTFAFTLLCGLLLTKDARELLMRPDKRWWLRPERKKTSVPITIETPLGRTIHAKTYDLSRTGAFLELGNENLSFTGLAQGMLNTGDELQIKLNIGGKDVICDAEIVRKKEAVGGYPGGMGIKFQDLGVTERMHLSRFLSVSPGNS